MPGIEETMAAAEKVAAGGGETPDNKLTNETPAEEVTKPVIEEEPEGDTTAEPLNTEPSPDDKTQPPTGKKGSDWIPRWRFNEINEERKEIHQRNLELSDRLNELEAKIQNLTKPNNEPQLDQNQQQVRDYYINPVLNPVLQELKSIKDELAATKESANLKEKLTDLSAKYPVVKDVPFVREVLENRYLFNPKEKLESTAEQLQAYFSKRDKDIITNYLNGKKTVAATNRGAIPPGSPPAYQPKKLPKNASLEDRMELAGETADARIRAERK